MAEEENPQAIMAEEEDDEECDTETDNDEFESEPDNVADKNPISDPNPNPNPTCDQNSNPPVERRVLSVEESRKLFQRLWTDEEEIKILKGFLDFTTKRGTTFASHQYDTGPFYEEIKQQLQLNFSKNQLVEKLRRLKKKYRNCAGRMKAKGDNFIFRSPHEQAVFEIARHIWRPANMRENDDVSDDVSNDVIQPPMMVSASNRNRRNKNRRKFQENQALSTALQIAPEPITTMLTLSVPPQVPVATETNPSLPVPVPVPEVEETVRTCLSPLFKELIGSAIGPVGPIVLPGIGPIPVCPANKSCDEKWRQQYILELEVYLRRIELVKEQVMLALEELKGTKS